MLSAIVLVIIAVAKFTEGAWVILVILPLGVLALLGLHRQYMVEERQFEEGAAEAAEAPVLNRHVVVVLIDRLDMATARAVSTPGRCIRTSCVLCTSHWTARHRPRSSRSGADSDSPAPPRRRGMRGPPSDRATLELAAETVADHEIELTILLPRRGFAAGWHRLLHDGTADEIVAVVVQLPHVNATVVPYQLTGGWFSRRRRGAPQAGSVRGRTPLCSCHQGGTSRGPGVRPGGGGQSLVRPHRLRRARPGDDAIGEAQWRTRVRVAGRIKSVRVQPRAGTSNLECVLVDDSGKLLLVFQGRRRIPGIQPGARLVVEGMVGHGPAARPFSTPTTSSSPAPKRGWSPPERRSGWSSRPAPGRRFRGCRPGFLAH